MLAGFITVVFFYVVKLFTYTYISTAFLPYLSYLLAAFVIGLSFYIFICSLFKIKYFEVFVKEKIFGTRM